MHMARIFYRRKSLRIALGQCTEPSKHCRKIQTSGLAPSAWLRDVSALALRAMR
jgi:hypothetical protein